MADFNKKNHFNVLGKYYVDDTCICCGICTVKSPGNMAVNLKEGIGYFYRQPETEQEEANCRQAYIDCPVNAIGNDGV